MIRFAKIHYYETLDISDQKKFWKAYKLINKEVSSIPTLSDDSTEACSDKQKADTLNTFFSTCWNQSVPPLSPTDTVRCNASSHAWPSQHFCTEEEILVLLRNLDCTKSTGPDGISARMLKETAPSISRPLTNLFNFLITKRHFPSVWKFANIVPIPKDTSCKSSPSNYRPISLLPIISKVFEKHIYSLLMDHLVDNCPISDRQWGYQAGKSTTTALAATTHVWQSHLDAGRDVAAVFFDFRKAFDSVPHRNLLDRLHQSQLHPLIIDLLHSYLSGRSQSVVVNGYTSEPIKVVSGVPQGSVLGPLLFILYVNSLCSLTFSENCELVMYADDLVLYKTILSEMDWTDFQNDIARVSTWTVENHLTFNTSKCKCMLFSRKDLMMPRLFLLGQMIEQVTSYKYLGVFLTSDLKWNLHIDNICQKSRRLLGMLYRKFYRTANGRFLCHLYISLVRPILEYASVVWDPTSQNLIKQLESVQKFALRICSHEWNMDYYSLLQEYQLPPLSSRRDYLRLMTLYNIIFQHFHFPSSILTPAIVSRSTRHKRPESNLYERPFARTSAFKSSFIPRAIETWNNLGDSYTNHNVSRTEFKHLLKHVFLL